MYATGSYALDAYEQGVSDLDVIAVARDSLDGETKERIVDALRHETIPCPARGLELVIYVESVLREPTADPSYELDLNTGPAMPFRASFDDADADRHWYVVDRAITRAHGIALLGPAPVDLIAPIPRRILVAALAASIAWHRAADEPPANAILNACRALRYADEGVWSSKEAAAAWAATDLARDAVAARHGGPEPDRARATAFLDEALRRVSRARTSLPDVAEA